MPVGRPTDPDGLTIKQRAFVHAYVGKAQGNGAKACRMVGYKGSDATLKNTAHKLIKHPRVAAAIRAFAAATEDASIVDVSEAKRILSTIARNADVEAKDRISALDKLLKSGGAYVIKHEVDMKSATVSFVFEDNGRGPPPPKA